MANRLQWLPGDLSWRAGALFMVGSACFALGSVPLYFLRVSPAVEASTFFVGSLFFTAAGCTQLIQLAGDTPDHRSRLVQPDRMDWWATVVQLAGMLFFNISTFRAMVDSADTADIDRLVWAPDLFGSIAFLVASHLAWLVVCGRLWCVRREEPDWWIAVWNYVGSIFFMLSAVGAYTVPSTGDVVNVALVNAGTFLGAACFFAGAYLLLPRRGVLSAPAGA